MGQFPPQPSDTTGKAPSGDIGAKLCSCAEYRMTLAHSGASFSARKEPGDISSPFRPPVSPVLLRLVVRQPGA